MRPANLFGETYGRLTITEFIGTAKRRTWWRAKCACGRETVVTATAVRQRQRPVRSCGCLRANARYEAARTPVVGGAKQCRSCGIVRPVGDYYASPNNADGIKPICKACFCARERESYHASRTA